MVIKPQADRDIHRLPQQQRPPMGVARENSEIHWHPPWPTEKNQNQLICYKSEYLYELLEDDHHHECLEQCANFRRIKPRSVVPCNLTSLAVKNANTNSCLTILIQDGFHIVK